MQCIAKANIDSRKSPLHTMLNVPRSVARSAERHELGEFCIIPDTQSRRVPKVQLSVQSGKSTATERVAELVVELVADGVRVNDPPNGADLNAGNITAGDGSAMVQFDLSNSTNRSTFAKRDAASTACGHTRDDIRYKNRTGQHELQQNHAVTIHLIS